MVFKYKPAIYIYIYIYIYSGFDVHRLYLIDVLLSILGLHMIPQSGHDEI